VDECEPLPVTILIFIFPASTRATYVGCSASANAVCQGHPEPALQPKSGRHLPVSECSCSRAESVRRFNVIEVLSLTSYAVVPCVLGGNAT